MGAAGERAWEEEGKKKRGRSPCLPAIRSDKTYLREGDE
jgi:hypothetical protein